MITWTSYMVRKAQLRGFALADIEEIVRYSNERYRDAITGRRIAIGRLQNILVLVAYEQTGEDVTPVTVHRTTRQQIHGRILSRRFVYE
jgi:uncharacterized DUF497 family protein